MWKELEATAKVPYITVLGDYQANGQVLVLPINGNGKCNLTFGMYLQNLVNFNTYFLFHCNLWGKHIFHIF